MKHFLILVLIFIESNSFALKPDSIYYLKPNRYGIMYKQFKIKTEDNYMLNSWFYPSQEPLSNDSMRYYYDKITEIRPYKEGSLKNPTIIICNGDAGNMSQLFSLAYIYCTNGFNVITFDWRGFGKSQYFPIDTNFLIYSEFITDYNAVINFTKQISTIDTNNIGVFGFSTGAFLSFFIASQRSEIKAIVTRGIFTDYEEVKKELIKLDSNDTYLIPKNIDNYSPKKNWDSFTKPIFLIVGENDKRTPPKNDIEILSNVKSTVRELWIVRNASHGGILAPEIVANKDFIKKTVRFFHENLK